MSGSKSEADIDRVISVNHNILPLIKNKLGKAKYLMRDEKDVNFPTRRLHKQIETNRDKEKALVILDFQGFSYSRSFLI